LAAITIVIANYPRHRDKHLSEQLVKSSHKVTRNITQLLQGASHNDMIVYFLNAHNYFFIRTEVERQNKTSSTSFFTFFSFTHFANVMPFTCKFGSKRN